MSRNKPPPRRRRRAKSRGGSRPDAQRCRSRAAGATAGRSAAARRELEGGRELRSARPRTAHQRRSGKVEVVEVFWLGCPHCYALEPYIQSWLKNKPAYIEFVRVPVMWGPVHRAHAQALLHAGRAEPSGPAAEGIRYHPTATSDAGGRER